MSVRYFTVEEANELLPAVRPLAERLVAHRRSLAEAEQRFGRLAQQIAGNGGGLQPSEVAAARTAIEDEVGGVTRCVEAIQGLGGLVKDPDEGLVDFPALRGEEEVLLCWRLGEEEVAYWHGTEEGFAGRRPLPL